jgi:HEAT repeat protein
MKTNRAKILIFALILVFIASSIADAGEDEGIKVKVLNVLSKFPAQNTVERDALASEIIKLGPEGILETCRHLIPPGEGDDARVRFALNGSAVYVNRTGAENERRMFARTLIKALKAAENDEVKAFLIRQLQITGKVEAVKPLSKFLRNKRLCEPATQALLAIRTPNVEKSLLKALSSARGANRITLIKALGEMRSHKAVKKIVKYAGVEDKILRGVTLYALANIGDPVAEGLLDKVVVASSPYDRAKAPSLYLLYARRAAESGRRQKCVQICRALMKNYTAPDENNIPCAALSLLAEVLDGQVLADLLAAVDSTDKAFRAKALRLAENQMSESTAKKWVDKMDEVSPEVKAEIIAMFGRSGEKTVFPVIKQALKSKDKVLRLAAIPAYTHMGGQDVLVDLIPLLHNAETEEIAVLKETLLVFPSRKLVSAAAGVLEETPPAGRIALIEILSIKQAREYVDIVFAQAKSENEDVRRASISGLENLVGGNDLLRLIGLLKEIEKRAEISLIQNAVVAAANRITEPEQRADLLLTAIDETTGSDKADLIRPLARIGGKKALLKVAEEINNEDPKVQTAAVYTIANWPDYNATKELLNICRTTEEKKYLYLALQGYIRLVIEAELTPEEKYAKIKETFAIVVETEEKNLILTGLESIKTLDAMKQAALFLDEPELQVKAAWTVVRIALPRQGDRDGLAGAEVIYVLKKAVLFLEDSDMEERVKEYIDKIISTKR